MRSTACWNCNIAMCIKMSLYQTKKKVNVLTLLYTAHFRFGKNQCNIFFIAMTWMDLKKVIFIQSSNSLWDTPTIIYFSVRQIFRVCLPNHSLEKCLQSLHTKVSLTKFILFCQRTNVNKAHYRSYRAFWSGKIVCNV